MFSSIYNGGVVFMINYKASNIKESVFVLLKGKEAIIMEEIVYYSREDHFTCVVPKKFKTDFASIPFFARIFFPCLGKYNVAAIIHDFLYSTDCKYRINRKIADQVFRTAMKRSGVSVVKRSLMYYAVRAFGWIKYKKS